MLQEPPKDLSEVSRMRKFTSMTQSQLSGVSMPSQFSRQDLTCSRFDLPLSKALSRQEGTVSKLS
jgi:hypothetical protein